MYTPESLPHAFTAKLIAAKLQAPPYVYTGEPFHTYREANMAMVTELTSALLPSALKLGPVIVKFTATFRVYTPEKLPHGLGS